MQQSIEKNASAKSKLKIVLLGLTTFFACMSFAGNAWAPVSIGKNDERGLWIASLPVGQLPPGEWLKEGFFPLTLYLSSQFEDPNPRAARISAYIRVAKDRWGAHRIWGNFPNKANQEQCEFHIYNIPFLTAAFEIACPSGARSTGTIRPGLSIVGPNKNLEEKDLTVYGLAKYASYQVPLNGEYIRQFKLSTDFLKYGSFKTFQEGFEKIAGIPAIKRGISVADAKEPLTQTPQPSTASQTDKRENAPRDFSQLTDKQICRILGSVTEGPALDSAIDELIKRDISCSNGRLSPKSNDPQKRAGENSSEPPQLFQASSGTGFFVSDRGHLITNNHVVEGCQGLQVHHNGRIANAVLLASDERNDLALLKTEIPNENPIPLSDENPYPAQDIYVAGYPFGNLISSTIKITRGIISSVSGLGNNYSNVQIDAALQPGNSGGPIVDEYGNAVGVAVSKLALEKILKDYGVVPENVNFGIKSSIVINFLEANNIEPISPNTQKITKRELSNIISSGTHYLSCWMTEASIRKYSDKKMLFTDVRTKFLLGDK